MTPIQAVLWAVAAATTGALTWAAYRGPPPPPSVPLPAAIYRAPTAGEVLSVQAQAQAMTKALKQAKIRTGTLPDPQGLEGADSTGQPWLPSPIPDNPLVAGVATVGAACGNPTNPGDSDWWYCPETGHVQPGSTQSGKE